ncbi:hypothetical protein BH20ACT18_BH20ACT18_01290 [soil metagenome]
MTDPRVRYLMPLGLWLAAAVLVTLLEGTPDRLPSVALGSTAMLHALRAGALFALGVTVATVLARAAAGHLPTQLSTTGIGYYAEETSKTTATLADLQEQIDDHQAALDNVGHRLDARGRVP